MPIQLDFFLRRLVEMAEDDPALRDRQPWKAAHERDYGWLAQVLADHYAGDDTNLPGAGRRPAGGVRRHHRRPVREEAAAFLRSARHPTLDRGYLECAYAPMVELLGHLRANGFANYIASGGGRDFMRPDQRRGVRHPPRGRDRQRRRAGLHPGRATVARSPGRERPTTSTTGRRSRCTSGPGPGAGRCWPPATPTATSRCSTSPSTPTSRRCVSCCCTTTPSGSSTTSPAPSVRSTGPRHRGLDGRQHQGRLGQGVLSARRPLSPPTPGSRPSSRRRAPRAATAARPCSSPAGR